MRTRNIQDCLGDCQVQNTAYFAEQKDQRRSSPRGVEDVDGGYIGRCPMITYDVRLKHFHVFHPCEHVVSGARARREGRQPLDRYQPVERIFHQSVVGQVKFPGRGDSFHCVCGEMEMSIASLRRAVSRGELNGEGARSRSKWGRQ